jgi:TolB-like protein/Flp pilus assembly protein TadD
VTDSGKAVFLSYASQDAETAQRLCNALRAAGIEVWFDQSELRGGDAWDQMIRRQVKACQLFVPIISANTQSRKEGYFRREWNLAVARTLDMAEGMAFLIPVVIDGTSDSEALVPEKFREVQWTRLPGGENTDAFVEHVRRLFEPYGMTPRATSMRPSSPSVSSISASVTGPTRLASRSFAPWILGAVVILAIGYLVADRFWLSRPSLVERPATAVAPAVATFNPPAHSIAVLPFVNMSGDPKQDYFSDGISEELLDSLSRLNDMQVVARTSSFSFKGQNADVSTIAHKLNVGTVLEGSVRRAGNTVRITVQLINTVTGFHIWSQTYDRNLTDILKVQSEVASAVARQLEITLRGDDFQKLELGGTKNPKAYDTYLRGMQAYEKADRDDMFRAVLAAADEAIKLDPEYAAAYVLRTNSLLDLSFFADINARSQLRAQMLAAAQRAVELAPEFGDAHLALAETRAYGLLDFSAAAPEFDLALALAPGSVLVQRQIASFSSLLGHYATALAAARRAVTLDPKSVQAHLTQGMVFYHARRYTEALSAFEDAKALNPDSNEAEASLAFTLLASGQTEKARQECETSATLSAGWGQDWCLALAYHALGRQADAERELEQFKATNGDHEAFLYAQIYAQWGDKAAALQWVATAYRLRDPQIQTVRVAWELDPIRNEQQFKAIEARLNFPP